MSDTASLTSATLELQARLGELSGRRVLLMLTDNTCRMLSSRVLGPEVVELRAHRMFLDAPDGLVAALAEWLAGGELDRVAVQAFVESRRHMVRAREPAPPSEEACRGNVHDLAAIAEHINQTYLDGRSQAAVSWGRRPSRKRVRSVRLGFYDPVQNRIVISRRLDRSDIPRYMVEYVVFHEMLHEVLGIGRRSDGSRDIHGRTFQLMEQTFPDYERARAFERSRWG